MKNWPEDSSLFSEKLVILNVVKTGSFVIVKPSSTKPKKRDTMYLKYKC